MKVFFFMDHNRENLSGVSWKLWKINRSGREVTVWWGPATIVRRRPTAASTLQSKTWRFRTEERARQEEERRIHEKVSKGYKRMKKRRTA
jgi:predicted DNA-binding WGR domain protein